MWVHSRCLHLRFCIVNVWSAGVDQNANNEAEARKRANDDILLRMKGAIQQDVSTFEAMMDPRCPIAWGQNDNHK